MRDIDLRNAVRSELRFAHKDDPETRIVEEMGIWSGSVRIDLAVINGELSGFELKSDRDNLNRLPIQASIYSRVFDKVVLVVGSRHYKKAAQIIPNWWGITIATSNGATVELSPTRLPKTNPKADPFLLAQLLWKDEALSILESKGLVEGWRSKRAKQIHQRLSDELPLRELKFNVRETLKRRVGWLR